MNIIFFYDKIIFTSFALIGLSFSKTFLFGDTRLPLKTCQWVIELSFCCQWSPMLQYNLSVSHKSKNMWYCLLVLINIELWRHEFINQLIAHSMNAASKTFSSSICSIKRNRPTNKLIIWIAFQKYSSALYLISGGQCASFKLTQ